MYSFIKGTARFTCALISLPMILGFSAFIIPCAFLITLTDNKPDWKLFFEMCSILLLGSLGWLTFGMLTLHKINSISNKNT